MSSDWGSTGSIHYGTVNADVLEHFDPDFRRGSMVERIKRSPRLA
jgi:hypothetical protein